MKESSVKNESIKTIRGDQREGVVSTPGTFPPRTDTGLNRDSSCSLADLLNYHDREFVLNAYAVIVNRQPEKEELTKTLGELRNGRRTKTEIVEGLIDTHPGVRIAGVSSSMVRKLRRAPIIGYFLRLFRSIARLPVLMQHQQQFESFIVGRQQEMLEYSNDKRIPIREVALGDSEDRETVSDTIQTVMMLSDSLIELSGSFAEAEDRLRNLEARQEGEVGELRSTSTTLTEALQRIQQQLEKSESQLSAALVSLTEQLQVQQQHLQDLRIAHQSTSASQREFLVNEQRAIVEAERAAVNDLQEQLDRTSQENEMIVAELKAELSRLRAAIEDFQHAAFQK
jgi:hypothetical protein